jgi:hypothetical protein
MLEVPEVKGWKNVLNSCRSTVGKNDLDKEPSEAFKRNILYAEHSNIRFLNFHWRWTDLPSWVSVHMVRHSIGINHFVTTQRTDRTGINRDTLPQGSLVTHEVVCNVQAIINISRLRMCKQASKETIEAWEMVVKEIDKVEPLISNMCVPKCVAYGFCPEMKPCGFTDSSQYKEQRYYYKNKF